MWNPFRNKQIKEDTKSLANINLFEYLGYDLPIVNDDARDYINRIWANVGAVYTATSIIYEKVYQSPLVFYKVVDQKSAQKLKNMTVTDKNRAQYEMLKSKAYEEVEAPKGLQELLDNPNPQQRWSDFLGVLCIAYLTSGNSYCYKDISKTTKKPLEMWAFPELHIESGGTYNPVKSYVQFWQTEQAKQYPAETIYHNRTVNPMFTNMGTQLYGVSPLRAFLEPLRTIEESYKQASKQMKNGGVLALLSPAAKEDALTAEQRNGFMDKLKAGLRSNKDFTRFMTSSISMDVQRVGLPSVELDLLNIRSADEKTIYKAYKIPLAWYNQEGASYNNQSEANRQIVYNAVCPMAKVISDMLTNHIGVHYGVVINIDPYQLPEMAINMKEQVEWLSRAAGDGAITPDEYRITLGYSPFDTPETQSLYYKGKPLTQLYNNTTQPSNDNNNNSNQQL